MKRHFSKNICKYLFWYVRSKLYNKIDNWCFHYFKSDVLDVVIAFLVLYLKSSPLGPFSEFPRNKWLFIQRPSFIGNSSVWLSVVPCLLQIKDGHSTGFLKFCFISVMILNKKGLHFCSWVFFLLVVSP